MSQGKEIAKWDSNIFELVHSHGVKVPVIGLGMVNWSQHKKACYRKRRSYEFHTQANSNDSRIIKTYFELYTSGENRKYFHNNNLKVWIVPAQPHHKEASPTAKAFEFEKEDGTRDHFCLESGATNCRVTKASNLSLFAE